MGRLPRTYCLLACIAALPSTSAFASCWQTQEARAARVRSLDTLLMLGAERCGATDAAIAERYGAFAKQHRATLDTDELVLKARFMREAGIAGGQQAYDDFVATLADTQSARLTPGLCSTIDDMTKLAAAGSAADLELLAASFASDAVAADKLCNAETTAAAAPAETPVVQTDVTEAPVPAAEPAKPALSQQEALAAAAAALRSATAALQASQAKPVASATLASTGAEQAANEPAADSQAGPR